MVDVVNDGSATVVDGTVEVEDEGGGATVELGSSWAFDVEQALANRSAAVATPARLSDQKEPLSSIDSRREPTGLPPQFLVALPTIPNGFLARRVVFHRTSITFT